MNLQPKRPAFIVMMFLPLIATNVITYLCTFFITEVVCVYELANINATSYTEFLQKLMDDITSTTFMLSMQVVVVLITFLVMGAWYYYSGLADKDKRFKFFSTSAKNKPFFVLGFIVFIVDACIIASLCYSLFELINPSWMAEFSEIVEKTGFTTENITNPLLVLALFVLGPASEELAFRGLSYKYGRAVMPFWTVNIIQALLFAICHGNLYQGCYAFLIGVMLGYVMEKTHNVYICIIMHGIYNVVSCFVPSINLYATNPMVFGTIVFAALSLGYLGMWLVDQAYASEENQ